MRISADEIDGGRTVSLPNDFGNGVTKIGNGLSLKDAFKRSEQGCNFFVKTDCVCAATAVSSVICDLRAICDFFQFAIFDFSQFAICAQFAIFSN
jgi:hypothetical protein